MGSPDMHKYGQWPMANGPRQLKNACWSKANAIKAFWLFVGRFYHDGDADDDGDDDDNDDDDDDIDGDIYSGGASGSGQEWAGPGNAVQSPGL